jgi:hypothetical protein
MKKKIKKILENFGFCEKLQRFFSIMSTQQNIKFIEDIKNRVFSAHQVYYKQRSYLQFHTQQTEVGRKLRNLPI